jgi:hypothetical protein
MKTATFKQQDYKISCSQKTRTVQQFPQDGWISKHRKAQNKPASFFRQQKKKFIYIYMYIYSKRQHQKRVSAFIFLASFSYWSIQQIQQLIPNSFSKSRSFFDYPHNSSCGYDWFDVTTTNGKTLPKKVFCFVSLFCSFLFFQRVAIYFISFIFKQENFYSVSGGTLQFYSIVNDILFLH